jgi:hypothetical protein
MMPSALTSSTTRISSLMWGASASGLGDGTFGQHDHAVTFLSGFLGLGALSFGPVGLARARPGRPPLLQPVHGVVKVAEC